MLAVAAKARTYPVLLPDAGARAHARPAPRRRVRLTRVQRAVAMALVLVVPAIAYVAQSTAAARTGYAILSLRQGINELQAENARLIASVTALKAPDRIERIATADLGMVRLRPQQIAALTLPAPALAVSAAAPPNVWQRLGALLLRHEAEASESR